MSEDDPENPAIYHVTESGTKWPNCLVCHSEDTTIVPKTGEWTCKNCGHQWHSDETNIDAGEAATIGEEIERLLRSLADESPRSLEQLANERDVEPGGGSGE